jgi:hypothetical protein
MIGGAIGGVWRRLAVVTEPFSIRSLSSGVAGGANHRGVSGGRQKMLGKVPTNVIRGKDEWLVAL